MKARWRIAALAGALALALAGNSAAAPLAPIVEGEQVVYSHAPANNGAGPMWCHGSTCLVHAGDGLFASGLETLPDAKPLNNCRWTLFGWQGKAWELLHTDNAGRTREPSPMAAFADGRFFVSANPTLKPGAYSGPARPELHQFDAAGRRSAAPLAPVWDGSPEFTEHSYRSLAADGARHELILLQNIGYAHAEWAFLDRQGKWSAQGKLHWPVESNQPIRLCYPNVALQDRAVHFVGTSDIVEPRAEWRAHKKQLTGQEWDYTFRRLFYSRTTNIGRAPFDPWLELANLDGTAGGITLGDLWLGPDGTVHLLWTERAIDERLRAKFFPEARQRHTLVYSTLREGKVVSRRVLLEAIEAIEGGASEIPGRARFQATPENRLFAVYYVSGRTDGGKAVSENRVVELGIDGSVSQAARLPLSRPMADFFTATVRAGSPPSRTLDMLGPFVGVPNAIGYARVRLY